MLAQPDAGKDSSAALTAVVPHSPWRVTSVNVLPELRLQVEFADGVCGTVDLSAMVQSPRAGVFAALTDPALFAQVHLECGTVVWPGDLDLAPDAMYTAIRESGEWRL